MVGPGFLFEMFQAPRFFCLNCSTHSITIVTSQLHFFPPVHIINKTNVSFLIYFTRCASSSKNNNWKVLRKIKSPKKTFTLNKSRNTKKPYNVTRKVLRNLSKHPGPTTIWCVSVEPFSSNSLSVVVVQRFLYIFFSIKMWRISMYKSNWTFCFHFNHTDTMGNREVASKNVGTRTNARKTIEWQTNVWRKALRMNEKPFRNISVNLIFFFHFVQITIFLLQIRCVSPLCVRKCCFHLSSESYSTPPYMLTTRPRYRFEMSASMFCWSVLLPAISRMMIGRNRTFSSPSASILSLQTERVAFILAAVCNNCWSRPASMSAYWLECFSRCRWSIRSVDAAAKTVCTRVNMSAIVFSSCFVLPSMIENRNELAWSDFNSYWRICRNDSSCVRVNERKGKDG